MGVKTCTKCEESKELDQYRTRDGKAVGCCITCHNARTRELNRKNPDVLKNTVLKYRYGITLQQKSQMFKDQDGKCAICPRLFKSVSGASVDHCHKTGKVRGLLCKSCNAYLGSVKDDPETIAKAANYVALGGV